MVNTSHNLPARNDFLEIRRLKWWVSILLGFLAFMVVMNTTGWLAAAEDKPPSFDIKGRVVDASTEEALPYANVMIKGTSIGTSTNTDGYFVLVNVPAGLCTLQVSYIGYSQKEMSVDNAARSNTFLTVKMEQKAVSGEAVTVLGENYQFWKNAEQVSQVTFSARELTVLPNLGEIDIFRSLQLLPGISGVSDGSAGLYVRGGTPDQNLVLLDGMTVYHVDHFFGFFSAFNADAIKDIQVYKGGFPAKYGGRLSSVVELTGKTGDTHRFRGSYGMNLLSANAVAEVPIFGKGSWVISARRSYTDFIKSGLYTNIYNLLTGDRQSTNPQPMGGAGPGGRQFNRFQASAQPTFYFYDLNSKLSFAPSPRDNLALSVYAGQDKMYMSQDFSGVNFRFRDSLNTTIPGSRSTNENTAWGNTGLSVKWSRQWADRFYTSLLAARSTYFSDHIIDRGFQSEDGQEDSSLVFRGLGSFASQEQNRVSDQTFRLDAEWHLTRRHHLGFGTWIARTGTRYNATISDTINTLNMDTQSLQTSLYLQDQWKPWEVLELTLGLRSTSYDQTGTWYYEPRAAFKYYLTDRLTLKGAWGRYHQFVNHITNEQILEGSRDFWLVATKDLVPGAAEHRILGLSYQNPGYHFEIQGYSKNLNHLTEFSRRIRQNADYQDFFFFGSGTSRGIELLAQKKTGPVSGWASYILSRTMYQFPAFNNGDPFPADQDRTHEVKLVGTYSKGPWNFAVTWVFASGRAYTAPESQYVLTTLDGTQMSYIHVGDKNSYRLPDYHRLDLSVSRTFESDLFRWDVGFSVFNLYNHKNVWYRQYDLNVTPVVITDVTMLGFTPTLYVKVAFK